jgi:hypothetical protein
MAFVATAMGKDAAGQYSAVCGAQDSGTARYGILYARRSTVAPDAASFPVWTAAHGAGQVTVFGTWADKALLIASFDGANLTLWLNNAAAVTVATTAALASTNQYQLGAVNSTGGFPHIGDIFDGVWFQSSATANSSLLLNQIKNWAVDAFPALGFTPPAVP